mmetsp:Transcript_4329/g.8638  ORF Transcript_4329/g.8638 Transcript_4329/m.8638 type:complete len:172 (+) Transcript_4329:41-556(+)
MKSMRPRQARLGRAAILGVALAAATTTWRITPELPMHISMPAFNDMGPLQRFGLWLDERLQEFSSLLDRLLGRFSEQTKIARENILAAKEAGLKAKKQAQEEAKLKILRAKRALKAATGDNHGEAEVALEQAKAEAKIALAKAKAQAEEQMATARAELKAALQKRATPSTQ